MRSRPRSTPFARPWAGCGTASPGYFGRIGTENVLETLTCGYTPSPDWTAADSGGRAAAGDGGWAAVAASRELGELAYEGSLLYRAVFGDALRNLIEQSCARETG